MGLKCREDTYAIFTFELEVELLELSASLFSLSPDIASKYFPLLSSPYAFTQSALYTLIDR
jgi:hypothetical protein